MKARKNKMESKKISLKMLKALRDSINDGLKLPDGSYVIKSRAYITAYGYDVENSSVAILDISKLPFYSEKSGSNWTYKLVIGYPRKQGE
jgi:hypothetical protein